MAFAFSADRWAIDRAKEKEMMFTRHPSIHIACLSIAAALLSGCSKEPKDGASKPPASASAPPASSIAKTGDGGGAEAGSASSSGGTNASASAFAGTYNLAPAPLFIHESKDYANVKQAKDDPSKNVGEGTMVLSIDGSGKVTGTVDTGPASPAVIDGTVLEGGEVRGVVRRKTPADDGLTGTFIGKVAGDAITGKLSLAEANAAILRAGDATLKKK